MTSLTPLPIDELLPQITRQLENHNRLVVQAAPGAGKTTRVPPALLAAAWLENRRIIVLEPRRLAARAAARRMAQERDEVVGGTVGYRTRLDTKVGSDTRIEVVTEGVLTRMLQQDPALEGVGAVLFDEFHERSLQADLGLALCLEIQGALREDLRLVVMSATLQGIPIAAHLGDAPVVESEGRSFPVAVKYLPNDERADRTPIDATVRAVHRAMSEQPGDVLVFLPGAGEIRRVQAQLQLADLGAGTHLCPLYGNLDQAQQDVAIRPSPPRQRKIVLATGIAETSLTIEGVRVVVDAGRMRVPRFDPGSGMTRLVTQRVSRASAEQRCGRAGRTAAGVCYRLWGEATQAALLPQSRPEILEADLAPLVLELARWGTTDPAQLMWLDVPPAGAYEQARTLLQALEALDAQGCATAHGQRMAALPVHPRLAHMLLQGKALGLGGLACDVAALLSERDLLRSGPMDRDVDLRRRVEALRGRADNCVDKVALKRVQQVARDLRRSLKVQAGEGATDQVGLLVALAYPDRIAQSRGAGQGRYRLAGGRGAVVDAHDALFGEDYLAIAALDGDRREARVFLAAPVTPAELMTHFAGHLVESGSVDWDEARQRVVARHQQCLGELVMTERPLETVDADLLARGLLAAVCRKGVDALPWSRAAREYQARVAFVRRADPAGGWPDLSDAALGESLADWLLPYLQGLSRWQQVQQLEVGAMLRARLDWEGQQRLDAWAPTHIDVPSGSRIRVDYGGGEVPVLAVRLQEMFGCDDTPRLVGGRVPVMLHLLSPAQRPVQVTRDLASFWDNTYAEVKKDLKGRYPKHYWPDDPRTAEATRRARPRKQ